jgi:hypothetical protein
LKENDVKLMLADPWSFPLQQTRKKRGKREIEAPMAYPADVLPSQGSGVLWRVEMVLYSTGSEQLKMDAHFYLDSDVSTDTVPWPQSLPPSTCLGVKEQL